MATLNTDTDTVDSLVIPVGPRLVSTPNTTSKVWRYFGLTLEESGKPKNSNLPVCRICFTEVSAKWGNTS